MTSIKEFYEEDHDRLDAVFLSFLKHQSEMRFEEAKKDFQEFQQGLVRHIAWEEEILFPFFEEKSGMRDSGPTAVMRFEHKQIKELLEKIGAKINTLQAANPQDEEAIKHILGMHNMKEENILYPTLDRMSSDDQKNDMFRRMNVCQNDDCCA